jgi:hydroxypyruvate isomerase
MFAANISTMFGEWEFLERVGAAADAGLTAVECQWPYEFDTGKLSKSFVRYDVPMVLVNAPAGDRVSGDRGVAVISGAGKQNAGTGLNALSGAVRNLGAFR